MAAPPTSRQAARLRFGAFELNSVAGELRKGGSLLRLKPQPFRVLWLLASHSGEPILREQLREEIWGGETFVDFERGLNSCITQIRAALGDDAGHPRYIETLPKRGYRFVAPVDVLNGGNPGTAAAAPVAGASMAAARFGWRTWSIIAVATILAASATTAYFMWPRTRAISPPSRLRLAILPFENLSGDPEQEFFSDGLTEEMITQLGGLAPERLGVIARTSAMQYKRTTKNVAQIGRELGVAYVLEGSARRDENRVRITAQLIQVRDQTHLWAETYESSTSDLLTIQSDVARRIAGSLQLHLLPQSNAAAFSSRVPEAHEAYMKGRHELARFTLPGFRAAIAHFERAIALDSNYAAAYAGLAEAYNFQPWWGGLPPKQAHPLAKAAAEKALQLHPGLAEAHVATAFSTLYFEWDFAAAEREARRAIELTPGLATAHYWYAGVLSATGRHEQALASMRRAQELDPFSDMINSDNGWYYFYARRYEEAVAQSRKVLERSPRFQWAQVCIVAARAQQHDDAATLLEMTKLMKMSGAAPARIEQVKARPPLEAARMVYRGWLDRLKKAPQGTYVSPYQFATLHAALGEKGAAIAALERALADHDTAIVQLNVDPRLDPLRGDRRFKSILERSGLAKSSDAQ